VELTAEQLAAVGIPEPARVVVAAAAAPAWLDSVPPAAVLDGLRLAGCRDPAAALHGAQRGFHSAPGGPHAPDDGSALLCVLGGSPALAGALASEGETWLDAYRPILHEERRTAATRDARSTRSPSAGRRRARSSSRGSGSTVTASSSASAGAISSVPPPWTRPRHESVAAGRVSSRGGFPCTASGGQERGEILPSPSSSSAWASSAVTS
jgi:hypothetical protein